MKQYKCKYCHKFIDSDQLYTEQKLKNGEPVFLKNGNPSTYKSHIDCDKKIKDRLKLFKHIESKYFEIQVPRELCLRLGLLGKKVDYDVILEFLKETEQKEIDKYIQSKENPFNDDRHMANFLMKKINENINVFAKKYKSNQMNKQIEEAMLNKTSLIVRTKMEAKNDYGSSNYDILD